MNYQELIDQPTPEPRLCSCGEPGEWPGEKEDNELCQMYWENHCAQSWWIFLKCLVATNTKTSHESVNK